MRAVVALPSSPVSVARPCAYPPASPGRIASNSRDQSSSVNSHQRRLNSNSTFVAES